MPRPHSCFSSSWPVASHLFCIIPVHILHDSLTVEQLNIMLPMYCLTGCDTTSSFRGHGKLGAFRLFIQKTDKFQGLSDLGSGPLNLNQKMQQHCLLGISMDPMDVKAKTVCDVLKLQRTSQRRSYHLLKIASTFIFYDVSIS